jgi:sugar phosphate isomerase/epimerase
LFDNRFEAEGQRVRLGCCIGDVGLLPALSEAHADFCELPVATLVMAGGDAEFHQLADGLGNGSVPPLAANVFLPGDLAICGATDWERIRTYVAEATRRLGRLGTRVLVFGSGRARSVPEGLDRSRALDRLEAFLTMAGEAAADQGITLVLEPLRRAESNVFNSVREAGTFLRQRRLANVRLLADLYHMMSEGEDFAVLAEYADLLAHVHVADHGRLPPGRGGYDIAGFLARLRTAGYAGDCSIECLWEDQAREVGPALAFLRRTLDAAPGRGEAPA